MTGTNTTVDTRERWLTFKEAAEALRVQFGIRIHPGALEADNPAVEDPRIEHNRWAADSA